jgi:FKBP-type peptidyl-prolyl cis-trans isomerase
MATPKSQRIGIWVIAIVMLVGTIGSFAVMILADQNSKTDQAQQDKLLEEYQKQLAEKQKEADALSEKYYGEFKKYESAPAEFDMNAVGDKVTTKDIVAGTGADITKDTTYKAYYIGWTPKGKVFDSSIDGTKLKEPLDTSTISLIEGWSEGVVGMKVGGVREITIPSDLAYGEKGNDSIPPNTPIKFIVMVIAAN